MWAARFQPTRHPELEGKVAGPLRSVHVGQRFGSGSASALALQYTHPIRPCSPPGAVLARAPASLRASSFCPRWWCVIRASCTIVLWLPGSCPSAAGVWVPGCRRARLALPPAFSRSAYVLQLVRPVRWGPSWSRSWGLGMEARSAAAAAAFHGRGHGHGRISIGVGKHKYKSQPAEARCQRPRRFQLTYIHARNECATAPQSAPGDVCTYARDRAPSSRRRAPALGVAPLPYADPLAMVHWQYSCPRLRSPRPRARR